MFDKLRSLGKSSPSSFDTPMSGKKSLGERFISLFHRKPALGQSIGFRHRINHLFSKFFTHPRQAKDVTVAALRKNDPGLDSNQHISQSPPSKIRLPGSPDRSPTDEPNLRMAIDVAKMSFVIDRIDGKLPGVKHQVLIAFQIYIEENLSDQNNQLLMIPWPALETPTDKAELEALKESLGKIQLRSKDDRQLLEKAITAIQSRIDQRASP